MQKSWKLGRTTLRSCGGFFEGPPCDGPTGEAKIDMAVVRRSPPVRNRKERIMK